MEAFMTSDRMTEGDVRRVMQEENQKTVDLNKPTGLALFGQSGAAAVIAQFGAVGVNFLLFTWLLTYYMPQRDEIQRQQADKAHENFAKQMELNRQADEKRTERIWGAIDASTKANIELLAEIRKKPAPGDKGPGGGSQE
jgi:hypothetical protein